MWQLRAHVRGSSPRLDKKWFCGASAKQAELELCVVASGCVANYGRACARNDGIIHTNVMWHLGLTAGARVLLGRLPLCCKLCARVRKQTSTQETNEETNKQITPASTPNVP